MILLPTTRVYGAMLDRVLGPNMIRCLVDLGFSRFAYIDFVLADTEPEEGTDPIRFIETWFNCHDPHVRVESTRREDCYEAHVWSGTECLNVVLRERGFAHV